MNTTTIAKITVSPQARDWLSSVTPDIKAHIIDVIRDKAQHATSAMVVLEWTCDGTWPHIERAFKDYAYRPGIRILFHITQYPSGIHVDKIEWRCNEPYRATYRKDR